MQVGEHVAHQRLVDQPAAEGAAVGRVVGGLHDRGPHPGGAADHAVQPRHRHHLEDGPHAAALFADQPADGAVELGLTAGVAAVAELVLEPLDAEDVALAAGQDPRDQEARQAIGSLGEDQEQVAHRRAGEPLVAAQVPAAVALLRRRRRVRADVGAALLLGHAHAGQQAGLGGRDAQPRVVRPAGEQRLVDSGECRRGTQCRDDGVCHRDGAAVTGLDLSPGVEAGGSSDVGAGAVGGPRRAGKALGDRDVHEGVPGRVELDLVDARAVAVVRTQYGLDPVGLVCPQLGLCGAGEPTEPVQVLGVPAGSLALEAGQEGRVGGDVVTDQRWRLVGDLMGRGAGRGRGGRGVERRHAGDPRRSDDRHQEPTAGTQTPAS